MSRAVNKIGQLMLAAACILSGLAGCNKALEVAPPATLVVKATAFSTDTSALSAVYGIYGRLMPDGQTFGGQHSFTEMGGLTGDEFQPSALNLDPLYISYYGNRVPVTSHLFWDDLYSKIYNCNAALEGISASSGMTAGAKQRLTGEVKFIRAFCYFYLVNIFGGVPLAVSTDYRVNNTLTRSTVDEVYAQIIDDLKDAESRLSDDYMSGSRVVTDRRLTVNKKVAMALLARVYLYTRDWQHAEEAATGVMTDTRYQLEPDLNQVFLVSSKEVIWQLQAQDESVNTYDGLWLFLENGAAPYLLQVGSMTPALVRAFEPGDQRRALWVGTSDVAATGGLPDTTYYFPDKYKVHSYTTTITERLAALRLAEQYLIRAEARAELGDLDGARADLDSIRSRAGLAGTAATDKAGVLAAIMHERRVEFFTEFGHRWLDLKRTGAIDAVMPVAAGVKGTTWNTNMQLYPIPSTEITLNPKLKQNTGY